MLRTLGFSLFCTAFAVATMNAGQIQIGGATGLSAAYVGAQGAGVGQRSYSQTLFVGDTFNGAAPVMPSGSLTDSNNKVTFSLLSDNAVNYWAIGAANGVTATMTVPVGISGITSVWTLLNDYWGTPGVQNTSVVLNFGNTASVAVAGMTQTFNFVNGTDIRDATNCSGVSTSPAPSGVSSFPTPCTNFARTAPAASQAFSTAYNGNQVANTQGFSTSGNLVLDDQSLLVNPIYFGKY
ncbi:MAG: hypothetical protein ABJA67_13740, partial [Chthonomonadales bacterium]